MSSAAAAIARRTAQAVLALLVLFLCTGAAALAFARWNGLVLLSVQSESMQPTLGRGDAVLVRQYGIPAAGNGAGHLRGYSASQAVLPDPGSIVSFYSPDNPGLLITHRLIGYNRTGQLITRGDAAVRYDRPIGVERLFGEAAYRLPFIGYVLDFIRHPTGLIGAVYLPATVLVGSELRRLARYYDTRCYRLHLYFE